MSRVWPVALAVLGAVVLLVATMRLDSADTRAQAAPKPTTLLVVGDSLSDSGNTAAVVDALLDQPTYPEPTIGLCHPVERWLFERDCTDIAYGRSRVSDGPVAVEHLAAHLGISPFDPSFHTVAERPVIGTNYAVAGAKARRDGVRDLAHQVDRLLLDHGPLLPPGTPVVVMIGGNDAIDALQAAALPRLEDPIGRVADPLGPAGLPDPSATQSEIVHGAVDGIARAATRLLDAGASCVIVANVPSLSALPAVRETAERHRVDPGTAAAAGEAVSAEFNDALNARLLTLAAEHPSGAALAPFDLHAHFAAALAAAAADGTNVEDACFDSERYVASTAGERRFHPECAPTELDAPAFEQFFFWDRIHPSGRAHAAVGTALIETYETSCPVDAE